ncbi:MAG: hypothetical protein QOJ99_3101 [Bryobacterales bacterium]|jgi:uncharacterized membrane protein|nr:hypothetical protein [Bryobacterales bacterium]
MATLNILMRILHILSAITLLGGILAWRFGVMPALAILGEETQRTADDAVASTWRPAVLFSVVGLLISGIYNYIRWRSGGLPPEYHAVIGVKFLLALHVLAVSILVIRPANAKRARQLTGVAISGVVIVILSAVLNWLRTQ